MSQSASRWSRFSFFLLALVVTGSFAQPSIAEPGPGGGGGGSGSGGSGSNSGSGGGYGGNSGSGSWGSGSNSGSGSGSWESGSSGGWSGSGDTLSSYESSNSGSGSSDSGSGSNRGSGSSNSGSGSSNSGSSNSGSGSSNSGSASSSRGGGYDDPGGWRTLAAREMPEFDRLGFPARRNEVLSVNLTKDQLQVAERRGFKVIDRAKLSALGLQLVRLRAPAGMSASDAVLALRAALPGAFSELDHYFGVTSGAIDDRRGAPMNDMKVPEKRRLWIGMIDTAVWTNATLRATRVDARNFVTGLRSSSSPPFAHGTAVASILARQGAVRITSANIFAADRHPYSSAEAIARAVNWMVERKVPVINISIAGPRNALVDKVIAAAAARGHVIVAAAGNEGPAAPPAYPAASPGALAVTAVDRAGRVYMKANRGPHIEIAALGVGIGAEAPDGTLKPHSGTSFAAPFVSAALARCIAVNGQQSSQACVRRMETRAHDLGPPGRDPIYGYGLLIP